MQRLKYLALIAAIAATGPASAGLLGQQVIGSLEFPSLFPGINWFDPGFGDVPSGYLNESGTTVTIQNPALTTYQFASNPGITAFQPISYTGKSST